MIVSWNWLKEYVNLDMSVEELTDLLTMTGLNLEGIEEQPGDVAIDLEVTSNRPDCLGHIGVAREISVLFDRELSKPSADPTPSSQKTADVTSVDVQCGDVCPRYVARVIRGVKVGPSPQWLQDRLAAVGITAINNIVDITNYVLMECGQPLHAFDFDKLDGGKIVVRMANKGEKLIAINQREYELDEAMCVIADASHPVALAGVMGGLETEIGDNTVNVLIESADFAALSVRPTARKLSLHSDSSYRFERGVDPEGIDWASRRCCELILELAGGELLDEPIVAGPRTAEDTVRQPIEFRFGQIPRILGIEIAAEECIRILEELGCKQQSPVSHETVTMVPPSWRRDLTREIDLVEEVARVHGYEEIPEDVVIPIRSITQPLRDRVVDRARDLLISQGFYDAVTLSFVSREMASAFQPFGNAEFLSVDHTSRRQENILRQSLIPSLLVSRRENERQGTFDARLFEVAKVYLSTDRSLTENQSEPTMIGLVTGQSYGEVKGIVAALARRIGQDVEFAVRPSELPAFTPGRGAEVLLGGQMWGWIGELATDVTDRFDLRDAVTVAELALHPLEAVANLTPQYKPLPSFPRMIRDLNFVLDEETTWSELEEVVREAAGPLLDTVTFASQYRGPQIPADKKSYVFTVGYRADDRTLTSEEVDEAQAALISACTDKLGVIQR